MPIQLRNINGNSFVYIQDSVGSAAIGNDAADSNKVKVVVGLTGDIDPSSAPASISVDPSSNGDIEFLPQGTTGSSVFVNGDVSITGDNGGGPGSGVGNLNMENTTASGLAGVINFGGTNFVHNFGSSNTFIGSQSGNFGLTGDGNVGVGATTLIASTSGSFNTCFGISAGAGITSSSINTGVGSSSLGSLEDGFGSNVAIGSASLGAITSGTLNTALGYRAGVSYTGSDSSNVTIAHAGSSGESNAIRIGTQGSLPGEQNKCFIAGIENTTLGSPIGFVQVDANGQLGFSAQGGVTSTAVDNTAAGTGALAHVTIGTGNNNTAFGFNALNACTTSLRNTAVGTLALSSLTTTANGNSNTAVGYNALHALNSGSGNNTAIGQQCLASTTADFSNVGVGLNVLFSLNGGGSSSNNGLGVEALQNLTSGSSNNAMGFQAGFNLATGSSNILLGDSAGINYTGSETANIIIGNSGTAAENDVIRIGSSTQTSCFIGGIYNTSIATPFGPVNVDSNGQVGADGNLYITTGNIQMPTTSSSTTGVVEVNSLNFLHSYGSSNTFLGSQAGNFSMTGANNIGVGSGALFSNVDGTGNVAIGVNALGSMAAAGANADNVGVGTGALELLSTGTQNTTLGHLTGSAYTSSESNNICIGALVTGTVGESTTTRIGIQGTQTACFIAGISGVTSAGAVPVVINSSGQLGTVVSSVRYKDNVQDMTEFSSPIMNLRPVTFSYKKDTSHTIQPGLIAEEVNEVMTSLVVKNADGGIETVKYHELVPMLLNEVIKLSKRIEVLESK